jgi:UDP-N-acetylglucosamine 1-carboxyvinyltransferase
MISWPTSRRRWARGMDELVIEGGVPLRGALTPSGNKNAAFPLIASALLTDQPVTLRNVPDISDVRTMLQAVEGLGVEVARLDRHTVTLHARSLRSTAPDPALLRRIRGALVLLGPMLAREGRVRFGVSGGDQIGRRRIDSHVLGLQALGAVLDDGPDLILQAERLRGSDILLDEASVTATENVLAAATLAEGTTVIRNAASEPHVQDQCRLLTQMGARIEGVGSNLLVVHGVRSLGGADFTLGPDFMEVGSFLALGAATGGEVEIRQAGVADMRMSLMVFRRLGVEVQTRGDDLVVSSHQGLAIVPDLGNAIPRIDDGPWPAFPADLMSVALVTATQASGTVLFHEKMYESRMFFVDRLIGMGARVVLCDPHRALVHGPAPLRGEPQGLPSPDIRAGIALVIAALCAEGRTVIRSVEQIDRGYEDLDAKLLALGARVKRVKV